MTEKANFEEIVVKTQAVCLGFSFLRCFVQKKEREVMHYHETLGR